jgi:hypothetical protein
MSQNSTVTTFRASRGSAAAGPSAAPHDQQNRLRSSLASPHREHARMARF